MKILLTILLLSLCSPTFAEVSTSTPTTGIGMDASVYDPTDIEGDSFDYANHFGNMSSAKIPNFDSVVSTVHAVTGVDSHDIGADSCKVTINGGDNTLIDIDECHVHIQGPEYEFTVALGIDPTFSAGENSRFIGVTMNGYTSQTSRWTAAQQQTIVPLARLNTPLGELGSGSTVHLVRDDRFFVSERDYRDRVWREQVFGALYSKGGELFVNNTTLVLGQFSGILFNAQGERQVLQEFDNMSAIFISHSSTGELVGEKKGLIIDNLQYDTGTGLATLVSNRWTNISILKSPKGVNGVQEGGWFYVYGGEYLTQSGAEAAPFDFAEFVSPGESGMASLATIILKKSANVLGTDLFIEDKRPCLVCRP